MAIVRAVKSGNWSDTTVWNTGALPTSADDVYSNTFTVTIDVSPTVLRISNASATGVASGGSFTLSDGIALTCTGAGIVQGATGTFLVSNLTSGQTASVVGNVSAYNGSNNVALSHNGAGTINITGSCSGSGQANNHGVVNGSSGTINLTGNASGGFGSGHGIHNASTGIVNITGTCTGGGGTGAGANNNSTGSLIITGSCLGGSSTGAGANSSSTGLLQVTGTITASGTASGITAGSNSSTVILTGPFITSANGVNPVYAARWFWQNTTPPATYYQIRSANLAVIRPLYTADSVGGNPAASNVRSGTVYGPSNELTGTCAVPGASSVLSGVPVDNTTGTATISAASIRSALGLASANLDSQLAAIPTTAAPSAAAIRTEMDSNSTKLANLDATISSRLATSGYTSPPTVGDIATAVWAAATRTLTTAIDNSATIAAAVWGYATGRTITGGTVDTLSNAPSVPSAATIASQVRTELTTELNRIDANVSSRLAPGGTLNRVDNLTNSPTVDVPTVEEIATEVRSELAPELARLSNAATTQEVADLVQEAIQP